MVEHGVRSQENDLQISDDLSIRVSLFAGVSFKDVPCRSKRPLAISL